MISKRIIPSFLIKNDGLIHRCNFEEKTERYIGDPVNTINVFNNYFTDEIIIQDIEASSRDEINYELLKDLSSEVFTPLSYGGGVKTINQAEKVINIGFEKIILNNSCFENFNLIQDCQKNLGAQSIIVSLDFIKVKNKYFLYNHIKKEIRNLNIVEFLNKLSTIEIGEMMLTSVSVDGMMIGSDIELIKNFQNYVKVPLIYRGGISSLENIKEVFDTNVNAVTSSSFFIMKKKNGGIVLSYPSKEDKKIIC